MPPTTARIRRAQLPVRARLIHRLKKQKQTDNNDDYSPELLNRGTSVLGNIRQSYAKRGRLDVSGSRRQRRRISIETSSQSSPVTITHVMSGDSSEQQQESNAENGSSRRHKRHVHFSNESTVKEIPHYSTYTEKQKHALWMGRKAIRRMVRRNTQEYSYEWWSPESTLEEEDFIVVSGVRVHPVHVSRERIKQLEAAAVLQEL